MYMKKYGNASNEVKQAGGGDDVKSNNNNQNKAAGRRGEADVVVRSWYRKYGMVALMWPRSMK